MKAGPRSLRREIVISFIVLLGGAFLVAALAIAVILPVAEPTTAFWLVLALLVGDLAVVGFYGHALLRRRLVEPLDALVEGTGKISDGAFEHRLPEGDTLELEALRQSVNAMADELLREREALAENVVSLEETNRELIAARDEVLRSARLASVGTLAAGIAHEVGNPLGALVGFTDLARMQAEREGRDPELLVSIREEAGRIDRIVRTLLEYARGRDRGAVPVDPAHIVHRVRGLLETQGKLDAVRTEWPAEESGLLVRAEAQQLEQVLVNLLLNALDAMRGGQAQGLEVEISRAPGGVHALPIRRDDDPPSLDYRHRRRLADGSPESPDLTFNADEVVVLTIRDHGPGIDPSHLEQVFDPFFTTKEPGKGTGLGLAICDRLVDAMGGRIRVDNHPEGGARFHIKLPLLRPEDFV